MLFRLDRTIGALLDHLDARLGRDGYVLALSADHGVADDPEQTGRRRRQPSAEIIATIDGALAPFFGPGKYVAHTAYTDIYLAPASSIGSRPSPDAHGRGARRARRAARHRARVSSPTRSAIRASVPARTRSSAPRRCQLLRRPQRRHHHRAGSRTGCSRPRPPPTAPSTPTTSGCRSSSSVPVSRRASTTGRPRPPTSRRRWRRLPAPRFKPPTARR